jgi:hypothetical protein
VNGLVKRTLQLAVAVGLVVGTAAPSSAFGVIVESYPNMSSFQASTLYDYITTVMVGGPTSNCALSVVSVLQGADAVPPASAGGPNNATVTLAVDAAAGGVPTALSGSSDTTAYLQQFVSIGNAVSGPAPQLVVSMPALPTTFSAGYLGYELAIVDLGKDLAPGSGNKNTERTTFRVQWSGDGVWHTVGSVTNTGGDFINVILLDLDGLPGAPTQVDQVQLEDAGGINPPQKGALDVDGVLRLTADPAVPTLVSTWGAVKAIYR